MIRKIKEVIKEQVDDISELAFDVIPENKVFPHIVSTISMDIYREGLHTMQIDFDVWDFNLTSKNIDDISEILIDKLDKFKYTDNELNFVMYLLSTAYIQDTNKKLKRKTCTFELQARKGK